MGDVLASRAEDVLTPLARARRVLIITQSVFFVTLGACIVIRHGPVTRLDGISYYGVSAPTAPLLITGYLAAGLGLWRVGALLVEAGSPLALRLALRVVALGLVALLLTPYDGGTFLNWAHMTVGVTMALVQLAIAFAMMRSLRSWSSIAAFIVLLSGGIIAAASLPTWTFAYLLQGEVVFEVGFAWSLFEALAWASQRAAA